MYLDEYFVPYDSFLETNILLKSVFYLKYFLDFVEYFC